MHSFLFKWRLKLASNGLEFENDAALVNSIKSTQFNEILEVIVAQKENATDHQKIQTRLEQAKKSESYQERIISMAFLIQAAWENDSSFDWKKVCITIREYIRDSWTDWSSRLGPLDPMIPGHKMV